MAWTPLPRPDERFRTRPKAISKAPGGTGMLDWTPKPKTKIASTVLEALPEPPVAALPVSSASARLRAALQYEDAEAAEVRNFLMANGLQQYVGAFMDNGFDCMEVVEEMEERHMKDLGMKPGHIIKLKLRLASSRGETPSTGTPQAESVAIEVNMAVSPPLPLGILHPVVDGGAMAGPASPGASLLDGQLDEEAEANAFKEAVAAWRNAGDQKTTKGRVLEEVRDRAASNTVPAVTTPVASAVKKCCYQCFRQYMESSEAELSGPNFCSDKCAKQHADALLQKEKIKQERLAELQSNENS